MCTYVHISIDAPASAWQKSLKPIPKNVDSSKITLGPPKFFIQVGAATKYRRAAVGVGG